MRLALLLLLLLRLWAFQTCQAAYGDPAVLAQVTTACTKIGLAYSQNSSVRPLQVRALLTLPSTSRSNTRHTPTTDCRSAIQVRERLPNTRNLQRGAGQVWQELCNIETDAYSLAF